MKSTATLNIGAIILAAGQSVRTGETNKLLVELDGVSMLSHVLALVRACSLENVVLVTGHEHEAVECKVLSDLSQHDGTQAAVRFVRNSDYASGMASSLQCGIRALGQVDAAWVLLGDMPNVEKRTLDKLTTCFKRAPTLDAVIPTFSGKRGNPILMSKAMLNKLLQLQGDIGAKQLLLAEDAKVELVPVQDEGVVQDFDTLASLDKLQRGI